MIAGYAATTTDRLVDGRISRLRSNQITLGSPAAPLDWQKPEARSLFCRPGAAPAAGTRALICVIHHCQFGFSV
jgi:hypothetical protein